MMNSLRSQKGFTIVEISVVVLVIGLLAFVGVRAWGSYESQKLANTTPTTNTSTVASIESSADLDAVQKELDAVDVAGEFEAELNSATTF